MKKSRSAVFSVLRLVCGWSAVVCGVLRYLEGALDTNRMSPLHLAIDRMDMKIVEMLLNYGINFDTLKNESGKTALELALEYGEHDIVKMISFHK